VVADQPQQSTSPVDVHLRTERLLIVSKRLVIFAALSLLATTVVFASTFMFYERLMISWLSFECGIIGGFVSIQQRLRKINDDELSLLSHSWAMILVIPIYGGIFALVLYVLFISGLVEGDLFPDFYEPPFSVPPTTQDIAELLRTTYPSSGADFAKLMFWTFVAGFSERFVPQIIQKVSSTS
jgi:hypothetical protein